MLKEIVVDVAQRSDFGKNASRRLRRDGQVPAILYGENKPPVALSVDPKAIRSILDSESGLNSLFQLRLDGKADKTRHVMIRDRQSDPVSGALVHVDFVRIDLSRRVQVEVPVLITGVPEGVKNEGGLLDFVGRSVEISCLPSDIPEHLEVDVSSMHIGQVLRVGDLVVREGVEVLSDEEQPLVVISAPKKEEEPAAEAAAEGEVPAEGAEPAADAEPGPEGSGEAGS